MEIGRIILSINWVDVLVVIILIRKGYVAFCRGLTNELLPLIGTFAALIASLHYYESIGSYISSRVPVRESLSQFLSFVMIGAVILTVVHLFVIRMSHGDNAVSVSAFFDNISGMTLGVMRGILLVSFIVIALGLAPIKYVQESVRERSIIAKRFEATGNMIYRKTLYVFSSKEAGK